MAKSLPKERGKHLEQINHKLKTTVETCMIFKVDLKGGALKIMVWRLDSTWQS